MTLFQLGQRDKAVETLRELRSLYKQRCLPDVFQTLVMAEKVFVEGHTNMLTLWDRISEGNLDRAFALLTEIRNSPQAIDLNPMGSVQGAGQQLAILFAWRAKWYEEKARFAYAQADYELAVLAAPEDDAVHQTLLGFNQRRLAADPVDSSPVYRSVI